MFLWQIKKRKKSLKKMEQDQGRKIEKTFEKYKLDLPLQTDLSDILNHIDFYCYWSDLLT